MRTLEDSNSSEFPRPPTLNIVGGAQGNLGWEFVYNWQVVNKDGVPNTLTTTDLNGTPTVYTVAANSNQLFERVPTVTYALTGTAVGAQASWPAKPNAASVAVPSPTSVNITEIAGVTLGSSTLPTSAIITDAAGNAFGVSYLGGGAAPANGLWKFAATLASAGVPLTVNGTTLLPIGAESGAGLPAGAMSYELYVVKGTTYTVAGGTVVFGGVGGAG